MSTALCTKREDLFVVTDEMREWQERSYNQAICSVCCVIHLFTPVDNTGRCNKLLPTYGPGYRDTGPITDEEVRKWARS